MLMIQYLLRRQVDSLLVKFMLKKERKKERNINSSLFKFDHFPVVLVFFFIEAEHATFVYLQKYM